MANPPLDPAKREEILTLKRKGYSHREIAEAVKVAVGTVSNVATEPFQQRDLQADMRRLLGKAPMSESELADALDVSPKRVRAAMQELERGGANLTRIANERLLLHNVVAQGGRLVLKADKDGWSRFGCVADKHLGNRHARLDVLKTAYQTFQREGIRDVLDAGNWIDGEARFNRHELLVFGMDAQLDYWIDQHPVFDGVTHFVSGDDHEGWYSQRESINIGQYAHMRAVKAGRKDLDYIGHVEADVELKCGKNSAVLRVMHPGGGSAYALSYAPQKIVESFQGGEKPQVLIIGHYHKFDYCTPREVHVISAGCLEDQSMFMRKKKLAAHVGFVIVRIKQNLELGHVERVLVEWNPFFDRGFYGKHFD